VIAKNLPKISSIPVKSLQIFYVPMLARVFDMKESHLYDRNKFALRQHFTEKIILSSQNTSYSIQKQTFNSNIMVEISLISDLDHGINF